MGWASGSTLMDAIIGAVQKAVTDEEVRKAIYRPIYKTFREDDWDTVDECLGEDPAFDAVVRAVDPGWFHDDDDDEDGDEGENEGKNEDFGDGIEDYLDGEDGEEN
jgi:hypothetical protein